MFWFHLALSLFQNSIFGFRILLTWSLSSIDFGYCLVPNELYSLDRLIRTCDQVEKQGLAIPHSSAYASLTASSAISSLMLFRLSRSRTNEMILFCCASDNTPLAQPLNFPSTSADDMRFFGCPLG
jgi:hypothetical protein